MQDIEIPMPEVHAGADQETHAQRADAKPEYVQSCERRPNTPCRAGSFQCAESKAQSRQTSFRNSRPDDDLVHEVMADKSIVRDTRIHDLVREYGDFVPALDHADDLRQYKRLGNERKAIDEVRNPHRFRALRTAVFTASYLLFTILSYR